MELVVLLGDDEAAVADERRRVLGESSGDAEEVDVSVDGGEALISAIRTPSMFTRRKISATSVEALSPQSLEDLALVAAGSSSLVVGTARKALSPKTRAALSKIGQIQRFDQPRGSKIAVAVSDAATAFGISLSHEGKLLCSEYPMSRVRAAFALLRDAGVGNPSVEDLQDALGSDRKDVPPWELTDAIVSGRLRSAVDVAQRVVPPVAVSVLTSHFAQVAMLLESGVSNSESAMDVLGLSQKFQADKLLAEARRSTIGSMYEILDLLGDVAVAVRSGSAQDALVVGVANIVSSLGTQS
jgi:DNA polymerase III delta subunit